MALGLLLIIRNIIDCRQMKWLVAFIGIIVLASGNLFAQAQTPSADTDSAMSQDNPGSEGIQNFVGTWIAKERLPKFNCTTIMKIGQYPDGIEVRFKYTLLYDSGEEDTAYFEGVDCRMEDGDLLFMSEDGKSFDYDATDTHSGIRIGHSKTYSNYRLSRKGSTINCERNVIIEYYDRKGYLITPREEFTLPCVYSREEDNW